MGDRTDEGSLGDSQTVHRRRLKAWWGAALACDADSTPLSQPPPLRPEHAHARMHARTHTHICIIISSSIVIVVVVVVFIISFYRNYYYFHMHLCQRFTFSIH